jgi:hypothetical protein
MFFSNMVLGSLWNPFSEDLTIRTELVDILKRSLENSQIGQINFKF